MAGQDRTAGKEIKFSISDYMQYMLKVSADTYDAMHTAKDARQNEDLTPADDARPQENRFKANLRELFMIYEPKMGYTEKDLDAEDLREKALENGVMSLSFSEAERLAWTIRRLQEHLGHTKFVRDKHKDEGIGPDR